MTNQISRIERRERHAVRVSLGMSSSTKGKLDQILDSRPRSVTMNDILLEAIDSYLDQQDDMIGSRQHFNRSLQARFNKLEAELTRLLMLNLFMLANGFAQMMQGDISGKRPPQAVNGGFYIRAGIETLIRDGEQLAEQMRNIQKSIDNDK